MPARLDRVFTTLVLGAGIVLSGCSDPEPWTTLRGDGLGTTWMVRWGDAPGVDQQAIGRVALEALREVDIGMSTWRDDSELQKVREADGPVAVSEETAFVVREALDLASVTGGAFDPTVQPLMEVWGLHGERRTSWPSDEELAEARAHVGWEKVTLSRTDRPMLDAGGTAFDLSAIAKGHAVDRIANAVSALGVSDLLVEVGGEVRTQGRAPSGAPWQVGVERPVVGGERSGELAATISVTNGAVATSGNYRARYELDGRVVHHTLDPRTGEPARADVLSATVLAPDCRTADGWATALMVLGPEVGLPMIEQRPGVEAWVLSREGEGWVEARSSGIGPRITSLAAD